MSHLIQGMRLSGHMPEAARLHESNDSSLVGACDAPFDLLGRCAVEPSACAAIRCPHESAPRFYGSALVTFRRRKSDRK